jgi:hypothetical protein
MNLASTWRQLRRCPPELLLLLVGATFADLGNGFFRLALPWYVYNETHAAGALAILMAAQYAAGAAGPLLGAAVDRHGSAAMLWAAALLQLVGAPAVAAWIAYGQPGLVGAAAAAFALSALVLLTQNAIAAAVQALTPEELRLPVNSLAALFFNVSWYLSPLLAGFAIAAAGVPAALLLDGASLLGLLPAAWRLPRLGRPASVPSWREAARAVFGARALVVVTAAFSFWNLTWGGVYALQLYFFRHRLHLGADAVGLLGTVAGVVPFAVGVVSPWILHRFPWRRVLGVTLGLSGLGMLLLPFTRSWAEATAAVGVVDGGISPVLTIAATLSQEVLPGAVYGRGYALLQLFGNLGLPFGSLLAGVLAGLLGVTGAMATLGLLTVAGALALLLLRV